MHVFNTSYTIIVMKKCSRYHPGVYAKDALDAMEMTPKEFSFRTGISEETLAGILDGSKRLYTDAVKRISCFFGNSFECWLTLQILFDSYVEERGIKS